ncbi:YesK-like family protein [Bacillus nakamurai]|uniref:YesK-like family protein n=1 Tax=Bacillus nakamurai TaxID=1793963 RepID=UPI0020C318BC|nr:YesK-like family protein [Bacillus nakamurai]MCP6681871.1 YesK-like family protein [Bacillus nakamurai]
MGYFYLIGLFAFCIAGGISAFLRRKWPKKMWPECLLAILALLAFGTVVYSIFGVGGWEGMGLGLLAIFTGFGAVAGYVAEVCFRIVRSGRKR